MLRAAVALQKQKTELSPQTFSDLRQALQYKAVQLLEPPRSEPNEETVRKRLHKQRDHLFTFLDHDGVDATNNLAERQLRPAVIARKISCGNEEFIRTKVLPQTQLKRLIKPEEIADAICFMVTNAAVSGELWADAGWRPAR
jgi:hypothetical protein